jgi:hypothetical protein
LLVNSGDPSFALTRGVGSSDVAIGTRTFQIWTRQDGTCHIARPNSSRPKSYLFRHTGDMAQMQALEAV